MVPRQNEVELSILLAEGLKRLFDAGSSMHSCPEAETRNHTLKTSAAQAVVHACPHSSKVQVMGDAGGKSGPQKLVV